MTEDEFRSQDNSGSLEQAHTPVDVPSDALENLKTDTANRIAFLELRLQRLEDALRKHVTNGAATETLLVLDKDLLGE